MSEPTATKSVSQESRRERRRLMAEAIKAGGDLGAVANEFHVTTEHVRRACRENGVTVERASRIAATGTDTNQTPPPELTKATA